MEETTGVAGDVAPEPVRIYDTTLRDGTQGENISFTAEDKLLIAERLDDFGIDYIEGGWPGSNPRDMQFFALAARHPFKNACLTAFGATRKPGVTPGADANLAALLESGAPAVAVFGKSWDLHVEQVMGNSLEENLQMIRETVEYLKGKNREVIYDAEHFFDGFRHNPDYALRSIAAAAENGADFVVLCETNGGMLPHEVESITCAARRHIASLSGNERGVRIGIHTHNDCGLAVANTLAAIRAGAVMVHGTVNGYGERCGNADLISIIPILSLKMGVYSRCAKNLGGLKKLSRFVSETANMIPLSIRPFVGESAFAHKGGVHASAVMKVPKAYEHISPEAVGNRRRILVSDLSGKSNVAYKAKELGVALSTDGPEGNRIVTEIKRLEQEGYQFEAADGSLKIFLEKFTGRFQSLFELDSFRVTIEKDGDRPCSSHATVKVSMGDRKELTAAEGYGPVSALDNALRKALGKFFPDLDTMRLVDFKVRVIDGREGTAARVRVLIESRDQDDIWSTVGVSEDIIEASWQALSDSFRYKLAKEKEIRNGWSKEK